MNFPQIDRNQAQSQLALLGYNPNEPIYLRFFYPSDDPRKEGDKGRKSNRLNFSEIENYQRQGRGAYFVINGGGHKNEDVSQGRAVFIEHDDLPKDRQRDLWQVLELPEPTFQVDTGGKSIHSYWVLTQPVESEQWCQLQRDLLDYAEGDRSIKNPARVMRLAGAWHISHNENGHPVYNQTQIIAASAKTYSFETLRGCIPEEKKEQLPLIKLEVSGSAATGQDVDPSANSRQSQLSGQSEVTPNSVGLVPRHPDQIQVPVPEAVPLLECCRKEVREWVRAGVQKGNRRNDTAINVGLELIAVERYLQLINQPYRDSARSLFTEFGQRSQMTPAEEEMRWRWCEAKNPSPSCGDDGIEACLKGWYWREIVKPLKQSPVSSHQSPKSSQNPPSTAQSNNNGQRSLEYGQAAETLIMERIDEILLNQKLTEAQQDLELNKVAKLFDNFNAKEIRAIAAKRLEEFEREDNLAERQQELEQLEYLDSQEYLPFADLFYDSPETVQAFNHLCAVNRKIQPQFFLTLLSIFSSLVGIKGSLNVRNFGRFRSTLNVAAVGESGEGKSIVSGILLDPLYQLQKERLNTNKLEKQQYQEILELWEKQHPDERGPKPKMEDYVTTSDAFMVINEYSREGIVKNHADNPNGLLIHQEELVAIQRAQNMYRQGKGDDRQFLNNLYDNKAIARSLKSERIIVDETAVSITGGYQPEVILGEMGDLSDPDGQWARFNFCVGVEKQVFTDLDQPWVDVFALLYDLYKKALTAPVMECQLDSQGRSILQDFIRDMEKTRWHTLQSGWRAVLSKASAEVCRIALGLHWMNCLLNNQPVTEIVPALAVKKAIKIKQYFLSQMQLIRTWGNSDPQREDSLAPVYRQVMKIAKRVQGTTEYLTVRMVQATRSGVFRKMKASDINKVFQDLANMGKAQLVTHKRSVALVIDSMFGDNGGQPVPEVRSQKSEVRSGVLLELVGGGSLGLQQIQPSVHQASSSFVGTVGIVAGVVLPPFNLPVTFPTMATSATMAQSQISSVIPLPPTPAQQFQQTPTKAGLDVLGSGKLTANKDVTELINLLTQWQTTTEPEFSSEDEFWAYVQTLEAKINGFFPELKSMYPDFITRWSLALERMLSLIPAPPSLSDLKCQLILLNSWVKLAQNNESESLEEVMDSIDQQMKRIGWSKNQGKQHLLVHYGVQSRKQLTLEQLLEFLAHLEQQPTYSPKVGQKAMFQGVEVRIERLVNDVVAVVRSSLNLKQKSFEVAIAHLSPVG